MILLNRSEPTIAAGFGPHHLALFCAPAVNLFPRRSDRINLAERDGEHLIVPDRTRPLDFEVFSVVAAEGYAPDGSPPQPFLPFYAANDLSRNPDHRSYFSLRREPRLPSVRSRQRGPRSSYLGHETFISLVDPEQAPYSRALRQLGLDLMCTNRDLALSNAGGQAAHGFHPGEQCAGGLDPLPGGSHSAAAVPGRRGLRLAVHQPSGAELSQPGGYRRGAGCGGAARAAAAVCAGHGVAGGAAA